MDWAQVATPIMGGITGIGSEGSFRSGGSLAYASGGVKEWLSESRPSCLLRLNPSIVQPPAPLALQSGACNAPGSVDRESLMTRLGPG
jgi:hypothetical protein